MTNRQMTWTDLTECVSNGVPTCRFARAPSVQMQYDKYRSRLMDQGTDVAMYVKDNVLGEMDVCIVPNAFPYDLGLNILHYVLFTKNEMTLDECHNTVAKHLTPSVEFICFRNPVRAQSIPGVIHYQIFIQKYKRLGLT